MTILGTFQIILCWLFQYNRIAKILMRKSINATFLHSYFFESATMAIMTFKIILLWLFNNRKDINFDENEHLC